MFKMVSDIVRASVLLFFMNLFLRQDGRGGGKNCYYLS